MIIKLTSLSSVRPPTKPKSYLVAAVAVGGRCSLSFPAVEAGVEPVLYDGPGEAGDDVFVEVVLMETDRDAARAEQLARVRVDAPGGAAAARLYLRDVMATAVARLGAAGDQELGMFVARGAGPVAAQDSDRLTASIEVAESATVVPVPAGTAPDDSRPPGAGKTSARPSRERKAATVEPPSEPEPEPSDEALPPTAGDVTGAAEP